MKPRNSLITVRKTLVVAVALLALLGIAAGVQAASLQNQITVHSQDLNSGVIMLDSVIAAQDGWVVIYMDPSNFTPDQVVGYAPVHKGANSNVKVTIDTAKVGELPTLWAVLQADNDGKGLFEWGLKGLPMNDTLVIQNGQPVVAAFGTAASMGSAMPAPALAAPAPAPAAPVVPEVPEAAKPAVATSPIVIADQDLTSGVIVASSVTSSVDGWIVVYKDPTNFTSGQVVGNAPVHKGTNSNVKVTIDTAKVGELPTLWAVLQADGGTPGVFEWGLRSLPMNDSPVVENGHNIVTGFGTAANQPSPSALTAGFDSERLWSAYNDWEPAIAVDLNSSDVYQLTTRYNGPTPCNPCPAPYIIFRRSRDGGAIWEADQFLGYGRKDNNDPQIEVASTGVIYTAWMDYYTPGVKFAKSSDHGATWSTPIALIAKAGKPTWSDKPILAISPTGKDVYIAFNASDAYVSVSHDYGATFARPLKISNDRRYWFHTGGAVAPNGAVYFAAVDYSQDYTGDSHINVSKSTNGGTTWTTTRVDTAKQMPACAWSAGCTLGFFGPSAALAIDKAGTLMIAYNAGGVAGQPQKMWVRTSTDGVTWSPRVEISNGSSTVNNGFPALAAGTIAGDFRVAWQDDRNGSTTAWNTWYRSTTNSGAAWSTPLRLSDLGSGAPYKNSNGYAFPYGDYFEIAVDSSGTAHVVWSEGTSYDGPGGTWYTRGK